MRVLVVEDDRQLAKYVRKGLEEEGYIVQVCFDASAGLKARRDPQQIQSK
jgi:DNA-binding response OmpR family regulator